jgi:hypothetical protein
MRLSYLLCLPLALGGISTAQDTNFPVGPQYLITTDSPLFLRPIATPSLSFEGQASGAAPVFSPETPPAETVSAPEAPRPANLADIYWGRANTSEKVNDIEISSSEPARNLPPSFVDTGVALLAVDQSLQEQRYGVTLAEVAAQWRAHRPHGSRLYTNRDIERLHGG